MRNVLVLSSEGAVGEELHRALGDDVGDVHIVVPAVQQSRLQWLTSDEDKARAEAERAAQELARAAEGDAVHVEAEAGDSDPLLAVEDALRTFHADEIVIITHAGKGASWLEEGAAETIAERFPQLPVKTIELPA
ncbi:MAG TPA: hypothetical protein VFR32_06610 [Gaiellaceae bacterium]|nr:hypothetical protein [Gaiellaceae bacterium]